MEPSWWRSGSSPHRNRNGLFNGKHESTFKPQGTNDHNAFGKGSQVTAVSITSWQRAKSAAKILEIGRKKLARSAPIEEEKERERWSCEQQRTVEKRNVQHGLLREREARRVIYPELESSSVRMDLRQPFKAMLEMPHILQSTTDSSMYSFDLESKVICAHVESFDVRGAVEVEQKKVSDDQTQPSHFADQVRSSKNKPGYYGQDPSRVRPSSKPKEKSYDTDYDPMEIEEEDMPTKDSGTHLKSAFSEFRTEHARASPFSHTLKNPEPSAPPPAPKSLSFTSQERTTVSPGSRGTISKLSTPECSEREEQIDVTDSSTGNEKPSVENCKTEVKTDNVEVVRETEKQKTEIDKELAFEDGVVVLSDSDVEKDSIIETKPSMSQDEEKIAPAIEVKATNVPNSEVNLERESTISNLENLTENSFSKETDLREGISEPVRSSSTTLNAGNGKSEVTLSACKKRARQMYSDENTTDFDDSRKRATHSEDGDVAQTVHKNEFADQQKTNSTGVEQSEKSETELHSECNQPTLPVTLDGCIQLEKENLLPEEIEDKKKIAEIAAIKAGSASDSGLKIQISVLESTIKTLQTSVDKIEEEKQRNMNDMVSSVAKLETRISRLCAENETKHLEAEQLRLALEEMSTKLEESEKRFEVSSLQAQNLAHAVWKEQSDRARISEAARTMSNQLAGAENEAYRLQSQLQDEAKRRSELEQESKTVRATIRNALAHSSKWEEAIGGILDKFDRSLAALDEKKSRVRKAILLQRKKNRDARQRRNDQSVQYCIACFTKPVSVCYVPCGHRSVCPDCDSRIECCPVCRGFIRERIRTFDAGVTN